MREYLPVLIVGGIIGMFALVFLIAYLVARRKKVLGTTLALSGGFYGTPGPIRASSCWFSS